MTTYYDGETVAEFVRGYILCMRWADLEDSERPLAPETEDEIYSDCNRFLNAAPDLMPDEMEQAGHDFWLTRQGHGAGFWDGDWDIGDDTTRADLLTAAAQAVGECWPYIGDDGYIYIG
jgi:hypothetical protein